MLAAGLTVMGMDVAVEAAGCTESQGPQGPRGVAGERGPQRALGSTIMIEKVPEPATVIVREGPAGFVPGHSEPGQSTKVGPK